MLARRLVERNVPFVEVTLDCRDSHQYPLLRWWRTTWTYPPHVGSVLGTPAKIIWLVVCLLLASLPLTGLMIWRKRRPVGHSGFPRRPDRQLPWWLIAVIGLMAVALPTVAASLLVVLLGEWVCRRLRPSPMRTP